jgi:hypothetical protein
MLDAHVFTQVKAKNIFLSNNKMQISRCLQNQEEEEESLTELPVVKKSLIS